MPNIEYIVTAEFHIDKGPSIVHQFPNQLPGMDNLYFLPELMLPDQIHKRNEDYTLFLLHRNTTNGEFQYLFNKSTCEDNPYYLYTIVDNRKNDEFKRGASIKSLSIITKLSYFKNFKPLLLICLDLYFKNNDVKYLEELYRVINEKKFDISPGYSVSIIKKLLITSILDLPINDKIYYDESFRNKLLGIGKDDYVNDDLFIRKDLSFNSVIKFNNMNIPIKIPILINILQAKLVSTNLNNELTIYGLQTPPIIILINAILTGKKIIFLSYEHSSGYIIDHILLTLKIITGGGILKECESFIAGTINPFFKQNDRLWDLMYDLDNNEFILSSQLPGDDIEFKNSIISEDAKFLSNLQLSLFNYNDDLTTIQLIFRRHINEIIRILLSSKNFNSNLAPTSQDLILLLDGIGYYWASDTNKLLEISCYQLISKKFHFLLYNGKLIYNLLLPNLSNELNLMIDLHYHLQSLNNPASNSRINEREIWFNILKFLISGKSLEIFLLITYLIPPNSSSSLQSSSVYGGNLTIFDKNKGIELLLLNLFNQDDQVKSNVIMILQELQDNFLCSWCLDKFLKSNLIYELAFSDLIMNKIWFIIVLV
ncbi:Docking domain of Afi1 for Arf3 in vesicle trafficking family protein [Candida albicans]|uniref:Docking domain of Afi1 for Arf3 in vesicle trafficking family protein n=1 Tax=Candida albicans TaxID=5476 RepID=A0A8H6C4P6_CANAX|nr:Docking domain of Afi1 for Arf3 in vesicle trafficking family protein [Candida albicans]